MASAACVRTRRDKFTVDVGYRNLVIFALIVAALTGAGTTLLVVAGHLRGGWRVLVVALGAAGVGFAGVCIGSLVLCILGWGFVTGTFREKPSVLQRSIWFSTAVAMGLAIGTATYAAGLPGLVAGPVLFAAVVGALRTQGFSAAYMDRRLTTFVAILAVVSIPMGLTVFL